MIFSPVANFGDQSLCISNSRDKYVRPYDKSTFVQELENNLMHDLAFDLEFSELEQLADDTIQVNLISEKHTALNELLCQLFGAHRYLAMDFT